MFEFWKNLFRRSKSPENITETELEVEDKPEKAEYVPEEGACHINFGKTESYIKTSRLNRFKESRKDRSATSKFKFYDEKGRLHRK